MQFVRQTVALKNESIKFLFYFSNQVRNQRVIKRNVSLFSKCIEDKLIYKRAGRTYKQCPCFIQTSDKFNSNHPATSLPLFLWNCLFLCVCSRRVRGPTLRMTSPSSHRGGGKGGKARRRGGWQDDCGNGRCWIEEKETVRKLISRWSWWGEEKSRRRTPHVCFCFNCHGAPLCSSWICVHVLLWRVIKVLCLKAEITHLQSSVLVFQKGSYIIDYFPLPAHSLQSTAGKLQSILCLEMRWHPLADERRWLSSMTHLCCKRFICHKC